MPYYDQRLPLRPDQPDLEFAVQQQEFTSTEEWQQVLLWYGCSQAAAHSVPFLLGGQISNGLCVGCAGAGRSAADGKQTAAAAFELSSGQAGGR